MGHSLYAVKEEGICRACGFNRSSPAHFRTHVPRSKWPESMGQRKQRVVVDGKVYDADDPRVGGSAPSPDGSTSWPCGACSFNAKTKAGLSAHQRAKHED